MIITYLVPSLCATKPCYDSGGMAGKWRLAVDTQNGTEQRHQRHLHMPRCDTPVQNTPQWRHRGHLCQSFKQTRMKRGKPGRPFLEKKHRNKKQENNWGICLWHLPCRHAHLLQLLNDPANVLRLQPWHRHYHIILRSSSQKNCVFVSFFKAMLLKREIRKLPNRKEFSMA